MADDLRAKIAEAIDKRVKDSILIDPAIQPGTVGQPFAATMYDLADEALAVVADWLRELAEMRNSSWLPVDPYALEDPRDVVARALHALADRLTEETPA